MNRKQRELRNDAIFELLRTGLSAGQAAKKVGTSKATATRVSQARRAELLLFVPVPNGRQPNTARNEAILDLLRTGLTVKQAAKRSGADESHIRRLAGKLGGMLPPIKKRSELRLSLTEREEISRCLVAGISIRRIAGLLDRHPSTICREVNANGGRDDYRAWAAEVRFSNTCLRPKVPKLIVNSALKNEVQARLEKKHSPRQIALCLMAEFPDQPNMRISHEAIYQALFIQGRGALRRELTQCLRTGRAKRKPQRREARTENKPGQIQDMVMISQRPAEVEDRAIPGHWEGDQIVGKNSKSAIGTLVERATRYTMLLKLKDQSAETMRIALEEAVKRLPKELFKSLTYDQGKEMAQHVKFSFATNVDVYFCDPHSPWQRGSNENTNGLLRQYFPKGTVLSGYSQEELDAVARELNERPRESLGLKTPAYMLDQLLR